MEIFLLIIRLGLAGVFGVAGMGKLFDPEGSEKALVAFGVPKPLVAPFVHLLPLFEIALGISLLFVSSSWYGAIGSAGLLAIFFIAMLYQMAKGNAPDCHCFGQIHSEPVGISSVLRNIVLLGFAVFLAAGGAARQGLSLVNSTQDMLIATFGLALVVLVGIAILSLKHISDQQRQIMRRIEMMEIVGRDGGSVERENVAHPHDGLPIGAVVPDFSLSNIDGKAVSLAETRLDNLPVLFLFVGPNCNPCRSLAPEFEQWSEDLAGKVKVAFVSNGKAVENRDKFGEKIARAMLLQKEREFADAVKAKWTPTALFIDANGRVASHVAAGDTAIRTLVEQIKADDLSGELTYFTNGSGHSHTTKIGETVPEFSIEDVTGNEITPETFKNKQTLVAFWSLGCGFCQQMIGDLRDWDNARGVDEPGLIVFSDGNADQNAELGLQSPVVLDEGHKTAAGFGMFGTPSAVLVNEKGIIVSETAVGAADIWALVGKK
ncbi:MAG: MauE/DoxX family redox-associated membrane protein [Pyrinomonadaceae bacterium]